MVNYIWLGVIIGGALLLGAALGYGVYKESKYRLLLSLAGVVVVAVIGAAISLAVSSAPEAPTIPPDPQGTQYDKPAASSRENALPGTATPDAPIMNK